MGKSAVPNLASLLHKRIVVRIGGGHTLKGLLTGYDAFMNIVLSEVTEPSGVEDTAVVRGEFIEDVVVAEEASLSVAGM
ncbi:SMALL NUCLEAR RIBONUCLEOPROTEIN G [Encephalitozoon cuniculi GB-M1]|uniref:SMALL NUCLEAR RIBONUCLEOPROTEIN G n=2 Tax=Encephalitozoon cuniculi TaxID=6035 RepID=Q8SRW7_ENCCU|nr:mRNA splicing protein SMX2 [Encephalitozoon cuniculi GB-M1]AGE95498.1 small nuclear ribonucleoprotein g [Encephalitozoon cuniculi]KMV66148.1 small nuclear ribonucleoprotein [Encephalitozoon cuniculi EcunIII-L]UYI27885.1 small nuclear ribonucleoprotein [Encephalitozoon cuniculi]CAD26611.1 SMALL NUCLEAR RIBONUCLEOPROTEIN G [Encephalitozoon cuniculi GB-M1]